MIAEEILRNLYEGQRKSVSEIGKELGYSQGKVNYWLAKHGIEKRSISDALYQHKNPNGDPFEVTKSITIEDAIIYGLGVGLYWGEGTKSNKTSVRLGNSDSRLVRAFLRFLHVCYGVDMSRIRFGLQVFSDMSAERERRYWAKELHVPVAQFYRKIIVTPHRGVGNYRKKTEHGVLTVYFNNRKLRDIICRAIDDVSVVCS